MSEPIYDSVGLVLPPGALSANLRDALGPIKTDIDVAELERRTASVLKFGLPSLSQMGDLYYGGDAIIVGSGMSLDPYYVAERQAAGARVFAVNRSHDYLIAHGVIPDFAVMLDPNVRVAGYQTPNRRVTYIFGTSVDKGVWIRFLTAGIKPFVFVPAMTATHPEDLSRALPGHDMCFIGGPTTVGLRTVNICGWMGFRNPELHAFDSCYAPGYDGLTKTGLYSVDKPKTYHDSRNDSVVAGNGDKLTFVTNGAMARQVIGFAGMLKDLPDMEHHGRIGMSLRVSGDGVIPWMAWKDSAVSGYVTHTHPDRMAAKYGAAKHFDYFKGAPADG